MKSVSKPDSRNIEGKWSLQHFQWLNVWFIYFFFKAKSQSWRVMCVSGVNHVKICHNEKRVRSLKSVECLIKGLIFCVQMSKLPLGATEQTHDTGNVAVLCKVFFLWGIWGLKNSWEGNIESVNPLTPTAGIPPPLPRDHPERIVSCQSFNLGG